MMDIVFTANDLARFWSKVVIKEIDDCWNWEGTISPTGYGLFALDQSYRAHRLACLLFRGIWPGELTVHHKCRNKQCVNPYHLEMIGNAEHVALEHAYRRENPLEAHKSSKLYCKRGHPLFGENVRIRPTGKRACRACDREREKRRQRTRK